LAQASPYPLTVTIVSISNSLRSFLINDQNRSSYKYQYVFQVNFNYIPDEPLTEYESVFSSYYVQAQQSGRLNEIFTYYCPHCNITIPTNISSAVFTVPNTVMSTSAPTQKKSSQLSSGNTSNSITSQQIAIIIGVLAVMCACCTFVIFFLIMMKRQEKPMIIDLKGEYVTDGTPMESNSPPVSPTTGAARQRTLIDNILRRNKIPTTTSVYDNSVPEKFAYINPLASPGRPNNVTVSDDIFLKANPMVKANRSRVPSPRNNTDSNNDAAVIADASVIAFGSSPRTAASLSPRSAMTTDGQLNLLSAVVEPTGQANSFVLPRSSEPRKTTMMSLAAMNAALSAATATTLEKQNAVAIDMDDIDPKHTNNNK